MKSLGCVDALLSVSHNFQAALEEGGEARLIQLDFSAASFECLTGIVG